MRQLDVTPVLAAVQMEPDDPAAYFLPVENYALQPLPQAFEDIELALSALFRGYTGTKIFDATAFYSRRKPDLTAAAERDLADFNQAAFDAAKQLGGLVVYYQGQLLDIPSDMVPSSELDIGFTPDCLSFCIWESRALALSGADVAAHKEAARKVSQWYTNFAIKKFNITASAAGVTMLPEAASIVFQEY